MCAFAVLVWGGGGGGGTFPEIGVCEREREEIIVHASACLHRLLPVGVSASCMN